MRMLTRRLQILLDEQRYRRVVAEARRRKVSVATVIREAIDAKAGVPSANRRAAAAKVILSARPMRVPDVPELLAELDEIRARRK